MFYAVDFYVDETTGYPYAYRLYEPLGSPRTANTPNEPETQFIPDDDWAEMAEWFEARGVGPFEGLIIQTEISPTLAIEMKTRWHDPRGLVQMDQF